jgi:hypothetical protein
VELYQLSYSRVATISRGNISSFSSVSNSFFVVLDYVIGANRAIKRLLVEDERYTAREVVYRIESETG